MRQSAHQAKHEAAPQGRLAELLDCERELAELLAGAREEALRRVADARADAERAEAELEASLEEESERVRREVREASQARVHEILGRAHGHAARFEGLSDESVQSLAASVFRRLLGREGRA